MATLDQYLRAYTGAMDMAYRVIQHYTTTTLDTHAQWIYNHLVQYGFLCMPSGKPGNYIIHPNQKVGALPIIFTFSKDVPVLNQGELAPDLCSPAQSSATRPCIELYMVDLWSPLELALTLIHETRHAMFRFRKELGNVPFFEESYIHETNTWLVALNLLQVWGGVNWGRALSKEMQWLREHVPIPPDMKVTFASSGIYWPELDVVFPPSKSELVKARRKTWLKVCALATYWSSVKDFSYPGIVRTFLDTQLDYQQ